MPQPKQRRPLSPFDARSVLLFAALTMGGALAQAQPSAGASAQARHQARSGPAPIQPLPAFAGNTGILKLKRQPGP